jgi:DNA-binding transcriptional MerR regulator
VEPSLVHKFKRLDISVGIGEASRITGATLTQIRYWEKKDLVHSFQHTEGRNKRFNLPNLMMIIYIKDLLADGYTLAKAGEMITEHRHQTDRLKTLIKYCLQDMREDEDGSTVFNFGALSNDPDFDVEARVTDDSACLAKVSRETTD